MIASGNQYAPIAYVDPFGRICLGLGKTATTDLKEAFLVYQIPHYSLRKRALY